jgi:hypothetical protein
MNSKHTVILSLFFLTIFSSCKIPNILGSAHRPINKESKADLSSEEIAKAAREEALRNFVVMDIDFVFFDSKAKIDYKDKDNDQHLTVNIRMKKDSIIWLSVNAALSIEAARILIKKDSIFIIDRINNDFLKYDFAYLNNKLNMDLNLKILQSLILGNLPVEKSLNDILTKSFENYYLLQQTNEKISLDNYVRPFTMKLEKLQVRQLSNNNILRVDYTDFGMLENYIFAFKNFVYISHKGPSGPQNTTITIEHKKAELSEKGLNFPFNVPQKYGRK